MFLSLLRQVIILIPMLLILPKFLGLTGVWIAGPISDAVASLITAIFVTKEFRKLNKLNQCEEDLSTVVV
jgi:Na+-driven multidrug efflux pump